MKKKNYVVYNIGEKNFCSHLDAIHSQNPKSDQYTGEIVNDVIDRINASGIIATISRTKMDLNRPRCTSNALAIDEFRETINEIVKSKEILSPDKTLTKNYLHLAIHGMKDTRGTEFEVGTLHGTSCSPEISEWFISKLSGISKNFGLDKVFPGDSSKSYHRYGDPSSSYIGYGNKFHTIQVEINRNWRKNKKKELVDFLSELIANFDKECN